MMDFLPWPMASFMAAAFISLLVFVALLNIFGLPANWIILGLDALWAWLHPGGPSRAILFWVILVLLALAGEALETGLQVVKAKKYGSSSSGTFMGMIGAIIGAIALTPLFWGLGALIGALAGAWLGCFCMELLKGKNCEAALHSAFGTTLGRLLGTICKLGIGAAMIALTARQIWQEPTLPLKPLEINEPLLTAALFALPHA